MRIYLYIKIFSLVGGVFLEGVILVFWCFLERFGYSGCLIDGYEVGSWN